MKNKYILMLIILIQIIIQIYVANLKSYIHMDEAYSLGLMNYDKVEIQDNSDFYNTWHNKEYYEDYISVRGDESYSVVYNNQKNDVHPPIYYLLLRIVSSFNNGKFSKWPGICLNIIINIFCTILVYLICKKIFKNDKLALLLCAINGLTVATLNTVLYIRMYELSTLNILIITYLHLLIYQKKLEIKDLILIGISALIGSLTHYYYLFFLVTLYVIYMIRYINKKEYKEALKYTGAMLIAGVVSFLIFPYSVTHMLKGNRGTEAITNLLSFSTQINNLFNYIKCLVMNIFGFVWLIILLIILGVLIYKLIKNKKVEIKNRNVLILIISIPTIVYFLLVSIMSPYIELRYIMPICPLVFIITTCFLVNSVLSLKLSKKLKYVIICVVLLMVIPFFRFKKIDMTYYDKKEIVSKLENEYNLPTIYLFNKNCNRFLDDILLFSKINESYVYDLENFSEDRIKKIFIGKDLQDGIIVFVNEGQENDINLEIVKDALNLYKIQHLKRMNACDIYYIK